MGERHPIQYGHRDNLHIECTVETMREELDRSVRRYDPLLVIFVIGKVIRNRGTIVTPWINLVLNQWGICGISVRSVCKCVCVCVCMCVCVCEDVYFDISF